MTRTTLLDNGLTLVTEVIPEFRSVTMGIWVRTGSRDEQLHQAGLSHFLEHLFFKGTQSRSATEIAEAVDAVGGQLNAFTEKEVTCFYARTMDQHLGLGVDILCDMLLRSVFDPEEIEREKGVVLEEIKMYEDAPDEMVFDRFTDALWGDHPLGRPILGRREAISALTRERLLEYVGERYVPSNMVISAAGNLDPDELAQILEEQFRDVPRRAAASGDGGPPRPRPGTAVHRRDSEQVYLCYGTEGLCHTDDRRYALQILDSALGGSVSSRLFQEIRERRGLVYTVCTFQNAYEDAGLFGVYAGTSTERLEEVLGLVRTINAGVRSDGLTPVELERARECLKGGLALALESTSNRMMRLARSQIFHGRLIPVEEVIDRVDAVTADQVQELAEELLDPERYALTVLGPVDAVEGVPARPPEAAGLAENAARRR